MNRSLFPLLIITCLITSGCATPQPISLLQSQHDQPTFWHQGLEFISYSSHDITVEIAYNREAGEYYLFDLAIYNESDRELLIDPAAFYYIPLKNSEDTLYFVYAEDPATRILEIDKKISRLKAQEINQSISSALMATAELTAVMASEFSENDEEEKERLRTSVYQSSEARRRNKAEINLEMMNIHQQRDFWKTQTLRKTTLFPDQYITGQVFFLRNIKAKQIILHLPFADKEFIFNYTQKLIKPISG